MKTSMIFPLVATTTSGVKVARHPQGEARAHDGREARSRWFGNLPRSPIQLTPAPAAQRGQLLWRANGADRRGAGEAGEPKQNLHVT
jgi:hypothetical protein